MSVCILEGACGNLLGDYQGTNGDTIIAGLAQCGLECSLVHFRSKQVVQALESFYPTVRNADHLGVASVEKVKTEAVPERLRDQDALMVIADRPCYSIQAAGNARCDEEIIGSDGLTSFQCCGQERAESSTKSYGSPRARAVGEVIQWKDVELTRPKQKGQL